MAPEDVKRIMSNLQGDTMPSIAAVEAIPVIGTGVLLCEALTLIASAGKGLVQAPIARRPVAFRARAALFRGGFAFTPVGIVWARRRRRRRRRWAGCWRVVPGSVWSRRRRRRSQRCRWASCWRMVLVFGSVWSRRRRRNRCRSVGCWHAVPGSVWSR